MTTKPLAALGFTFLLILAATVAAKERDPDYDRILEAYKAKRWSEVAERAPAFLEAKPDYVYGHSIRYMLARSLKMARQYVEAARFYREYVDRHADGKYAGRCWSGLVSSLNLAWNYEGALAAAEEYLERRPEGETAEHIAYERAYALEGLRRFAEAVAAYRGIVGSREERAAYRAGVALFRGRKFKEARQALQAFLTKYPKSSWERAAREYLFRTDTGFSNVRDGIVRDYSGKYGDDPRLPKVKALLPEARAAASANIRTVTGKRVPNDFLIRLSDAGRSKLSAATRIEVVAGKPRHVVILHTEHLMMGAIDLEATLTHELYHCLQRQCLGEEHFRTPKWVREGTALYVAGQGESRMAMVAAGVGRDCRTVDEAVDRMVNGLGGRHRLEDYAEDVSALLAVEERHGKKKLVRLLRRLLETSDVEKAIEKVLAEDMETFERRTAEYARETLRPLVTKGHEGVRKSVSLIGKSDFEGALQALPEDAGIYAPTVTYFRAYILELAGRHEEALEALRSGFLKHHRHYAPLIDNALCLEVKLLKELGSEELSITAARARKDLEPTGSYPKLLKHLE